MASKIKRLHRWHTTKLGLLSFAGVELLLAYASASMAINSGNLWYYLLTVLFVIGTIRNSSGLVIKMIYGVHKRAT